jgi:hypothetical protein
MFPVYFVTHVPGCSGYLLCPLRIGDSEVLGDLLEAALVLEEVNVETSGRDLLGDLAGRLVYYFQVPRLSVVYSQWLSGETAAA